MFARLLGLFFIFRFPVGLSYGFIQLIDIDRLFQKGECSHLMGQLLVLFLAMTGQDNHFHIRVLLLDLVQNAETIYTRHPQVQNHDFRFIIIHNRIRKDHHMMTSLLGLSVAGFLCLLFSQTRVIGVMAMLAIIVLDPKLFLGVATLGGIGFYIFKK